MHVKRPLGPLAVFFCLLQLADVTPLHTAKHCPHIDTYTLASLRTTSLGNAGVGPEAQFTQHVAEVKSKVLE